MLTHCLVSAATRRELGAWRYQRVSQSKCRVSWAAQRGVTSQAQEQVLKGAAGWRPQNARCVSCARCACCASCAGDL
jgi:hypothetical protein